MNDTRRRILKGMRRKRWMGIVGVLILSLMGVCLIPHGVVGSPDYEDFLTYTEIDTGSDRMHACMRMDICDACAHGKKGKMEKSFAFSE